MQENTSVAEAGPGWNPVIRWLALAGVVGPILFLSVLTILGFLRPGYSPIRQAGSDLGVGPNAWILNLSFVITGLLLIAFAIGFFLGMDQILTKGWRLTCLVLLVLSGVGFITAGIFTEAPATVTLHWTLAVPLTLLSPLVVCFIVGRQWRRVSGWRGYGRYSLLTALGVVAFYLLTYAFFIPSSPLSGAHIGGLLERVLILVVFAWYVVIGWRLFVWVGSQQRVGTQRAYQGEPEPSRGEQDAPFR
jgi:hypothetical membrane protein